MPIPGINVSSPGLDRPATGPSAPTGAAAFTRRAVLGAGGVAPLAALLGETSHAYAATTAPVTGQAVNGQALQPSPYYVQASCDLSEDYFLTDRVIVSGGDRVMPFARADGTVEAIVLASGVLAHLARDASTVSGWSYTVISTGLPSITDAAVAASAAHGVSVLVVGPRVTGPVVQACIVALGSDGVWSITSTGPLPNFQGAPVAGGVTAAGDLYWYGWTQTVSNGQYVYQFFKWDGSGPNFGITHGRLLLRLSYPLATLGSIVNVIMLYDARPGANVPGFAVVTIADIDQADGFTIQTFDQAGSGASGVFTPSAIPVTPGVAALHWAYCTPTSRSAYPGILWQEPSGIVVFQDETGAFRELYGFGATAGDGQVAAWLLDGMYAFTIIDDGVAQAVTQFGVIPNQAFTLPIPLVTGIDRVYGQPSDPTQATLFVVDWASTFNVLAKDATGVWSYLPIHQDGATLQQVTSWRIQLLVQDANTTPSAERRCGSAPTRRSECWQSTGNTMLGSAPVTLTADPTGRITFSIPTSELDTATLTAQALDADGQPTGGPASIDPDTDAHHFLAGGSSLTDIGMLSSTALLGAQNADGTPLLPGLTNLPSGQLQPAQAVVGALQHTAALGLGSTPQSATDPRSAILDFTGNAAQRSRPPRIRTPTPP